MNEKYCILIPVSLKLVPMGPVDNKLTLAQVVVWRQTGDKPLPESMLTQFTETFMRHKGGGGGGGGVINRES